MSLLSHGGKKIIDKQYEVHRKKSKKKNKSYSQFLNLNNSKRNSFETKPQPNCMLFIGLSLSIQDVLNFNLFYLAYFNGNAYRFLFLSC
jgi:hypothetical protein